MNDELYKDLNKIYEKKKAKLIAIIDEYIKEDVIVAFTGGVGSSLLLSLFEECSKRHYGKVYAITIKTMLKPSYDIGIARKVAKELNVRQHTVLRVNELEIPEMQNNPVNRCYLCKKCIFSQLKQIADDLEVPVIVEGTNSDEDGTKRAGNQAVIETGVKSPFIEAGFTKENVVRFAKERNISVAEKPNSPCFATRFPFGTRLDLSRVKEVEQCEEYLKSLGLYNVRVRVHDRIARIEVAASDFNKLIEHKEDVTTYLKEHGFDYVTMDLSGFISGSMNFTVKNTVNESVKNTVKDNAKDTVKDTVKNTVNDSVKNTRNDTE